MLCNIAMKRNEEIRLSADASSHASIISFNLSFMFVYLSCWKGTKPMKNLIHMFVYLSHESVVFTK